MSKRSLGNFACFQIFILVVSITLAIVSKTIKFDPSIDMYNVRNLHENWQKPFYSDIIVANDSSQCSSLSSIFGSNFVPIFTYTYPGMEQSCDCSTPSKGIVTFSGECPASKSMCEDIPEILPQTGN